MSDYDDDYDEEDDLDLSTLADDELVEQMHDDLYNGLKEEIAEGTQILLDRGWDANKVLNEALVDGMTIVGIDFRDGILFVPEVLSAANAMKAAMEILRPLLSEHGSESMGKIVIGTVKGDIHDIGKNLVAMMMEVDPTLTPAEVSQIIQDNARPLPGACSGGCGAGLAITP